MKKLFVIMLVTAIMLSILTPLSLAETKKIDGARLERGTKNIALGWTEVPDAVIKVTKETNNPLLGITFGLVKGVLNAFARTVSGGADVIASPVNPKNKEQMMKSEMIQVTESTK